MDSAGTSHAQLERLEDQRFRAKAPTNGARPQSIAEPLLASMPADDAQQFQRMIEALPEQIALLDDDWTILTINDSWRQAAAEVGQSALLAGRNYREFCRAYAEVNEDAAAVLAGLDDLDRGRIARFRHEQSATGPSGGHDYQVCISRIELAGRRLAMIARYEITSMRKLMRQCRRLEDTLLLIQTQERQRIGRDLHDSTAQLLVELQLSLIRLKQLHSDKSTMSVLGEIEKTLDHVNHEIRAISYLLHPPSLEAGCLVESLEEMARGFSRRTDLEIRFDFVGENPRWDPLVEASLYRLAQEALANVQRHAHASTVAIRLVARPDRYVHLIIQDDGVGISREVLGLPASAGVGLAGMRARVEELSGRFTILRRRRGTCLVASIPLDSRADG